MVLDQRDVGCAGRRDARRPQLRDTGGHGRREQPDGRPPVPHACPRRLVGPVGDDDLGPRRRPHERIEAATEVREPVHRRDDDRELGARAHRPRSASRWPRASPMAQATSNAIRRGSTTTRRARSRRRREHLTSRAHHRTSGTTAANSDARQVDGAGTLPPAAAAELAPVRESLTQERRRSCGSPHADDHRRIVQQLRTARCERAVHVRLPESLPPAVVDLLQPVSPVGRVVTRQVERRMLGKRQHVPAVATEVLGQIDGRSPAAGSIAPPTASPTESAARSEAIQFASGTIGEIVSATRSPVAREIPSLQSSGTSAPSRTCHVAKG